MRGLVVAGVTGFDEIVATVPDTVVIHRLEAGW